MKNLLLLVTLLLPIHSFSASWLSASGTITSILTYAKTNTILVNISSDGATVAECTNTSTFAISKDIDPEARARMYSMLLAAQASGRPVTISFANVGGCEPWDSESSVYRKIVRLY